MTANINFATCCCGRRRLWEDVDTVSRSCTPALDMTTHKRSAMSKTPWSGCRWARWQPLGIIYRARVSSQGKEYVYIGQICKYGDACDVRLLLRKRQNRHISDSLATPPRGSYLFHSLLHNFQEVYECPSQWPIEWDIIDHIATDDLRSAQKWCDVSERAAIAQHGGNFKSGNTYSLNLCEGGREHDNRAHSNECSTIAWNEFLKEFMLFIAHYNSTSVPFKHMTETGYPLGMLVGHVRSYGTYVVGHPERCEELNALGFVWDARVQAWQRFVDELHKFIKETGTANVPLKYVTPNGYRLGQQVGQVRVKNQYLKARPERKHTLDALGFVWKDTRKQRAAKPKAEVAAQAAAEPPGKRVSNS